MASSESWVEYVDLISTSSMEKYKNTNSNFTNDLPIAQDLPEHSLVALQEIHYTSCFYNVEHGRNSITVWDRTYEHLPHSASNSSSRSLWGKYTVTELREGYYETIEDVLDMLNASLKRMKVFEGKPNVFQYDKGTLRVHYNMRSVEAAVHCRGLLLNILGAEVTPYNMRQSIHIGLNKTGAFYEVDTVVAGVQRKERRFYIDPDYEWTKPDSKYGYFAHVAQLTTYSSMVVYCDIIVSQVTGEHFSDVLRFLPIKAAKNGTQIIYECQTPHFLKVRKRYINSINIQIRDLQGHYLDFKMGTTRIKLRFKQEKQL